MPEKQQPEALRLAALLEKTGAKGSLRDEAAAELRRLHTYCQELEAQVIRDCMTHVQNPAAIEHAAGMGDPLVTAAPAAVAGPSEAVAYLDVGAGGYLDLGTGLTDEALSRLPKGRHALVIAGTYGIDGYIAAPTTQPAPKQEALEQAGERVYAFRRKGLADFCTCDEARYEELSNKPNLFETRIFYTAPQPSPADQRDALSDDAVRVPLDSLHADAAYLIGRLREGSMSYARVIEIIRERIDAAKAAIRARAEQGDALDAARYRWLREGNDAKHGAAWHVAVNLYGCEWDAAIDAARKQGANHD